MAKEKKNRQFVCKTTITIALFETEEGGQPDLIERVMAEANGRSETIRDAVALSFAKIGAGSRAEDMIRSAEQICETAPTEGDRS